MSSDCCAWHTGLSVTILFAILSISPFCSISLSHFFFLFFFIIFALLTFSHAMPFVHHSQRQALEVRVMSLYLLHCLYRYLPIHQNPFLCLFVDIYNLALQDENLKSERFVTSVILNGKGEEVGYMTLLFVGSRNSRNRTMFNQAISLLGF